MFFRRVFSKTPHHQEPTTYYPKEMTFEDTESSEMLSPTPPSQSPPQQPVKLQKRRSSIEEKPTRGLSVLQLTPLWEHIIRTNSLPHSLNIPEMFNEFYERLHDPEWQVRQHALRVLVDVLIVMGQQADYHIGSLLHPLVDNLGHIAPAVRKGSLDALRVYVASTAMPETVMLDVMNYGMNRSTTDPYSGRMTVAVMLALPALILPVLITPKRSYVVKSVMDALAQKMAQITYQEIALKIFLKIKEMVGDQEFNEYMPPNVQKDFELLCKVYGLPRSPNFRDSGIDLHVPSSNDNKKSWGSKFVPKKDIQGNAPSSYAPVNYNPSLNATTDGSNYFGSVTNYYDMNATYPIEQSKLGNNLGTPKRTKSPRQGSGGIMRSASDNHLNVDVNGNGHSSGSESGGSSMSLQTQNNTSINSKPAPPQSILNPSKIATPNTKPCCNSQTNQKICTNINNQVSVCGKVIMETEIKITPETAVTMRILEQNPSTQTDDSDDENNTRRIITDFSAPYPVTPIRSKSVNKLNPIDTELDDIMNNNVKYNSDTDYTRRNTRRVRFGGELVKMRTPDSDTIDHSDEIESSSTSNGNSKYPATLPLPPQKQLSNLSNVSDNSSISSDNSNQNEYIKQPTVGFANQPMKSNIEMLKEKKLETNKYVNQGFNDRFSIDKVPESTRTVPTSHSARSNESRASSAKSTKSVNVQHSPMRTMKTFERVTSSSSTDYSQELTIGIPDNETVLPSHFTPPNIVIKKTNTLNPNSNFRPATSPMLSPRIITIPPTSSSNASSKNNSPMKSNSGTPIMQSPSRIRNRSFSPERIRRSASMLSPRMMHREVTMMHNLQRSPMSSPGRSRRGSMASLHDDHVKFEEGTQTSIDISNYNPKLDEMTQTPNNYARNDEMTQTTINGSFKAAEKVPTKAIDRAVEKVIDSGDTSPSSSKDSPTITNHNQLEYKTWEQLGIVDYFVLKDLKSGDWHSRSRALCAVEDALKSSDNLAMVQPYLDSLLRSILTAERNTEVIEDQRRLLSNLITRLPLENLEDRVTQIVTGMCRQGGAGSNLVAKALMQRLPTASIVLKLLSDDFLQARSSKFRENALQMVIFALMTFPSTYFDIATCVSRTTTAALDRKKRVRQAALDVLAVLGQISSPKNVIDVVTNKVEQRKDGMMLIAAVKARLARKQLPLVGTDGEVQYSLKIPSGNGSSNQGVIMFGSDVEWICSGSGSVSPTSMKNRSFKIQSNSSQQDTGRLFEERRIVEGMNRYSNIGSTNSGTSKFSPWSRIPVKDSSEEDHGYIAGQAIQSIQRVPPSTGRFYGKLQSRSFPELSDATKEKPPIRQLSDSDNQTNSAKWGQNKLPVASTKFPNMENQDRNNSCLPSIKNPYSFAPGFKTKSNIKLPLSSDGFYSDSIGSPLNQSLQLESRPRTHPPTDNVASSANGHRQHKSKRSTDNQLRRNSGKINNNELMIQPLTSSIALIDDGKDKSNQEEIIKSTTNSARSKKSEAESNKSMVENYVEEQTRRNSVKTNHHILSDTDDNYASNNSTPKHNPIKSADPSLKEMQNVRDEIAQIQTVIENVKKEMVEMQKQQNERSSPSSRPPSENSNKTFVCEDDEVAEIQSRPKTAMSKTRSNEDVNAEVAAEAVAVEAISTPKTRPSTSKSILKPESPFRRSETPLVDEIIADEQSFNSPIDNQLEADYEEDNQQHYEEEQEMEEVDEASQYTTTNNETLMRTDSSMSKDHSAYDDKDHDLGEEEEEMLEQEVESNCDYSPPPAIIKTPSKVKRQPPLKRNHKVTPVKNAMPNVNQQTIKVTNVKTVNKVYPPSLRRFEKPKEALYSCLSQLDSSSWETVMAGLQTFVRLIRHHPEYVEAQIHLLTIALSKHVKNLRSQVSRAACSAANEFFMTHAKCLDADAEELSAALLNRTADTNKFLRGDALKALEAMCDALHPSKVILILTFRGAAHQNAVVRCTTAKLLNQLVFRIGCDKVFNMHKDIRDRLILTGANLLMEGSLETRNYTKNLFKQLSIHSQYQKLLLEVIPSNIYRNIEKALKSIR